MQIIKFKGSTSDGVIRTYEKQAKDINGLNIDVKNQKSNLLHQQRGILWCFRKIGRFEFIRYQF